MHLHGIVTLLGALVGVVGILTHKVGQSYSDDSGTVTSTVATYTDDSEVALDASVPASTTNKEYDLAVSKTDIKSMVLYSDVAVTIKTNSSSTPQETIALAAKQSLIWASDHSETCPFANDVTKFFISNAGTAAANVKFRALLHTSAT